MRVLLLLLTLLLPGLARQNGSLFLQSYLPATYGASPQNWAVVQDARGIIYAANTEGLLEFDGHTWRLIRIGTGIAVRSLAIDLSGTIWVGGQGDFGFLKPDDSGSPAFVSLLSAVPADHRKFQDVWRVHLAGEHVFFGAYARIFRWSPATRQMRVWAPQKAFGRTAMTGGVLYAMSSGAGLLRFDGDRFHSVPGAERFVHTDVREVLPWRGGLLLVARSGLFAQKDGSFERVSPELEPMLHEAIGACLLRGGRVAVTTSRMGVLLLRPDLTLEQVIDRPSGIHSGFVSAVAEDREGGYWLATSGGLERLQPEFQRFDQAQGLKGSVYAVARQDGRLLAGTDTGLYALGESGFELFDGIGDAVFELAPTPFGTLACAQRGMFLISGTKAEPILKSDVLYSAAALANGDVATVGRRGLFVLHREGNRWRVLWQLAADKEEFRGVEADDAGRLWVATRSSVLRVQPDLAGKPSVTAFGAAQGVAEGFKGLYRIRGKLVLTTPKGLMELGADGMFHLGSLLPGECPGRSGPVYLIREGADRTLWVSGQGYHGLVTADGRWQPLPLVRADLGELYGLLAEPDGTVWASGTDGFLVRYDSALAVRPTTIPLTLRRLLVRSSGRTVFGGLGASSGIPALPWADHDLRFEVAAPFLERPDRVEYQVRLEGHDAGWSAWTAESRFDYTNLGEGNYALQVRARTPTGLQSEEVKIRLHVRPPWFRTWWAWMLWTGAIGFVLYFGYRWRSASLRRDNERLERVVEERTAEIRAEEQKTQELLLNILPGQVAEELKRTGNVNPVHFESVTVCFTDFEGFTNSTEHLEAAVIVTALHDYFSQFDAIIARYGLEKLKTIGDAYMFAGGLPEKRPSHAVDAVMAALEISALVSSMRVSGRQTAWRARIGLHSGPVAAGVVGVRKFAFDIWGATVNLASRIESSSEPGRVNVSQETWAAVQDLVECESRGLVWTKDRRQVPMYFVSGPVVDFAERYQSRFGYPPPAATWVQAARLG